MTMDSHPPNGTAPATEQAPEPDALLESIRAELRALLAMPLTHGSLATMASYCQAASHLAAQRVKTKSRMKAADAVGLIQPPPIALGGGMLMYGGQSSIEADGNIGDNYTLSGASTAETYGVRAMRELLETLGKQQSLQHETPYALVRAIAEARTLGLTDIVAELSTKLKVPVSLTKPKRRKTRSRR